MGLLADIVAFGQKFWIPLAFVAFAVHLLRTRYKPVLRDIPGPFLASLSDLWLLQHCLRRQAYKDYELHRKYNSPLLRLGPNTISVSDIEASRIIYGWKPVFKKARLYISQHQTSEGGAMVHNLSSEMDEAQHGRIRRPVAFAYAMSTVLGYEPLVDNTSKTFMKIMEERFAGPGIACDFSKWLQMYAFDVIGEMTFSKQFGFLTSGEDLGDMMLHTGRAMDYIGMVGQIPDLDEFVRFKLRPCFQFLFKKTNEVVSFTMKQIREHVEHDDTKSLDFLTRFQGAKEKYPDIFTDAQLAEYANTNISAGSDTTAIALRELVYRLLTNPKSCERFMEEVKAALKARPQDEHYDQPITWTEGYGMPYFQACIKECLRIHSALGQLIPREVPEGGVELCGKFIPAGTVVGCNAWTIHRDKKFYGEDADEYKPERWLSEDKDKLRDMANADFAFGGGPRVCIGKNIALLEINKFIPELFRRFEMQIVDPNNYKLLPGWLVLQHGLEVTLKKRDPESLLS